MELHKKVLETPTTLCTGLALDITLRESGLEHQVAVVAEPR